MAAIRRKKQKAAPRKRKQQQKKRPPPQRKKQQKNKKRLAPKKRKQAARGRQAPKGHAKDFKCKSARGLDGSSWATVKDKNGRWYWMKAATATKKFRANGNKWWFKGCPAR